MGRQAPLLPAPPGPSSRPAPGLHVLLDPSPRSPAQVPPVCHPRPTLRKRFLPRAHWLTSSTARPCASCHALWFKFTLPLVPIRGLHSGRGCQCSPSITGSSEHGVPSSPLTQEEPCLSCPLMQAPDKSSLIPSHSPPAGRRSAP